MKKTKYILKFFAFIFIIKASFLFSFAFIWDDLWLDLYKNIDSWVWKLNNQMYSYELKWASPDWSISEKINSKLKNQWLENCKVSESITEDDVHKIAYWDKNDIEKSWDLWLLSQKIEWECTKIEQLNKTQEIIRQISIDSQKSAKVKSDAIYNISKTGIFSDGNIKNSPFDIVKDIKDIDYIIFTQEIDYDWEENISDEDIWDFLEEKLDKFENKLNWWGWGWGWGWKNEWWKTDKDNSKKEDKLNNNNNNNDIIEDIINWESNTWTFSIPGDNTQYSCPSSKDESWLSSNDINKIINSTKWNWNNKWEDLLENWPINKNFKWLKPLSSNPFSFSVSWTSTSDWIYNSPIWKKEYIWVNDNKYFGWCETFFCIEIEFVTHNWNLLIGWTTRSIESIMERSNNHLKKFANSSLVQSKMTTNNFELSLRDLNLSDIFSMPIVIIKKTPPILDLDFFNNKVAKEKEKNKTSNPNPLSRENLSKARFESIWINYERENDLSIYLNRDSEIKNIINNAELSVSKIKENQIERNKKVSQLLKLNDHVTRIVQSNYQAKDTDWLYKEFIELEMFTKEIQNYIEAFDKIAQKMLAIPIHP